MFGFKKKNKVDSDLEYVLSKIRYNVNPPSKTYEITSDEMIVIEIIIDYIRKTKYDPKSLHLIRLSDGAFTVYLNTYYLGKIKLQGKKKFIQYMKTSYDTEVVYFDTVEEILPYIVRLFNKF
jgi:hypothetical protein